MGDFAIIGHFKIISDLEIMGGFDLWVTLKPTHY